MRKIGYLLLLLFVVLGLNGCSDREDGKAADSNRITKEAQKDAGGASTPELKDRKEDASPIADQLPDGSVVEAEIESEAIAKNVIGDSGVKKIYIYLPPSYSSSEKAYPVVYFLHGYGDQPKTFMTTYQSKLNEAFQSEAEEFILVALDGNNISGGSFFVNSPVSGNWEDYVVKELVQYMDTNYRTITHPASRGISGYSMGGFGALYLALRHPDLFQASLVFCPGVLAEDALEEMMDSWKGWSDVKVSYAQAFSPNPGDTQNYGNILKESDIEAKNSVWEDWMNGYSNWGQKLDDYLALNKPLKAIKITYSPDDNFTWIPGGCKYLAGLLKEKGINYELEHFNGGHIVPADGIENYFVPFFGNNLSYE